MRMRPRRPSRQPLVRRGAGVRTIGSKTRLSSASRSLSKSSICFRNACHKWSTYGFFRSPLPDPQVLPITPPCPPQQSWGGKARSLPSPTKLGRKPMRLGRAPPRRRRGPGRARTSPSSTGAALVPAGARRGGPAGATAHGTGRCRAAVCAGPYAKTTRVPTRVFFAARTNRKLTQKAYCD